VHRLNDSGVFDVSLVVDEASGNRRIYHLNPDGLAQLRADLDRFWLSALTAYKAARRAGVPTTTLYLIEVRASQINGCSVCLDMHSREITPWATQQRYRAPWP
jgi:alkylhydroperoxidase family enzyme